jgi:hypothetical protein
MVCRAGRGGLAVSLDVGRCGGGDRAVCRVHYIGTYLYFDYSCSNSIITRVACPCGSWLHQRSTEGSGAPEAGGFLAYRTAVQYMTTERLLPVSTVHIHELNRVPRLLGVASDNYGIFVCL